MTMKTALLGAALGVLALLTMTPASAGNMSTTQLFNYGTDTWDYTVIAKYTDSSKPYEYEAGVDFYHLNEPRVVMGPAIIAGPDGSAQWTDDTVRDDSRHWYWGVPAGSGVLPTGTVTIRGSATIQPGYANAPGTWGVNGRVQTGNGTFRYGSSTYSATFRNTRTGQIVKFDNTQSGDLPNTNTSVGLEVEYADKIELVPGGKTVLARYKPINASGTGYRVHVNASKDVASMIVVVDAAGNRVRWNDTVTATTGGEWSVEALQGAPNGVVQGEITIDVSLV